MRGLAVYAHQAIYLSSMATRLADMRHGGPARAGTFGYSGQPAATGWHTHDLHQLEYSLCGAVELETTTARYLLPPQQAVWIPAGITHQTTVRPVVRTVSAFFRPDLILQPGDRVRILAASPLMREMLLYGLRWPVDRDPDDAVADAFFVALANLVADSLDHETPMQLPASTDPLINVVMAYTSEHLDSATPVGAAAAAGVSERTLRRKFPAATGMNWHAYLTHSRLLRAMALLADDGPTVLQVAATVGYESHSAFTRAFTAYTGQTPTAYRQRVTSQWQDRQ
jgi:AraC-like DNA-binding protein